MISLRDVVTGFGVRDPLAEVWRRSLRGGGGGAAEITGVPPLQYIGDGRPLTDYLISGNTVQNGTPSADAPVDVIGCGAWDETRQSYKLPLTVNGVEHPIYLGTVPTTRRIKKLVLTGEEYAWSDTYWSNSYVLYGEPDADRPKPISDIGICSHFVQLNGNVMRPGRFNIQYTTYISNRVVIGFGKQDIPTLNDFKAFLAAQYASGTPVTVWYVLAEPETAVVNEPLMKIGDYADTVSFAQAGVTIPTVNGENVLDVPTTVPPSEITIKGGISSV